jgi:hypothetical protein
MARRHGRSRPSSPQLPRQSDGGSRIDIHRGEALMAFARTYPTLPLVLIETMQNAIDNEATAVFVGVDLVNRNVVIADNGIGTDREKFEMALASVGKTVKDKGKLGKFGRGLVSPLDKCKSFTFASRYLGRGKVLQWTFREDQIRGQHFELTIPCEELTKLPAFGRRYDEHLTGRFDAAWHTVVRLNGVTEDKVISLVDLDELVGMVRIKLGSAMRTQGVVIRVVLVDATGRQQVQDIDPVAFKGEPLEVLTYDHPQAGQVQFELFRAPKLGGKRKGEVGVVAMEDNYPITIGEFIRQARGRQWAELIKAPLDALASGYFEGTIRCKNIELHEERTKFEFTEALVGLYEVIDQWYTEHGHAQFENEQLESRDERYRQLGIKSMDRLQELLKQPQFERLWDSLKSVVQFGRLGDGHLDPVKGKLDGHDDDASTRSGQGGAGKARTPGGSGRSGGTPTDEDRQKPAKDRPGDTPIGTLGTGGTRRQLVKGDSQGLWFDYDTMPGSSRLWEFDFQQGILTFNIRHPLWVMLDETNGKHTKKHDKWIMHLQEWVALEVLSLLMHFPKSDDFEQHRVLIDSQAKPYVELFITAPASR